MSAKGKKKKIPLSFKVFITYFKTHENTFSLKKTLKSSRHKREFRIGRKKSKKKKEKVVGI